MKSAAEPSAGSSHADAVYFRATKHARDDDGGTARRRVDVHDEAR